MDELVIVGLVIVGGWVLGIVGFFRAGRARAEVRELRALLAKGVPPVTADTDASASPWAPPPPQPPPPEIWEPEIIPEPTPAAAAAAPTPEPPSRDLEALLTTRWGVWLGAAALMFAGVFLVRYAVEQGLLGPGARCVIAVLLGIALLAAAEWLQRHDAPGFVPALGRDQAPAALAAGGIAVLFAAAYGAGPFYDLLPAPLGFAAMAAASFAGLLAALRFGQLTAAIGVAGAFATPLLVATDSPSLPGLFAYLLAVSAAAQLLVRYTAWVWLGWATAIAGAAWIVAAAQAPASEQWATAAFVVGAVALNVFLLPGAALEHRVGRRLAWVPFACLGAAGLILEVLVPGNAPRMALLLLSPVAVGKGVLEPRLDRLPWLAALFGLLALLVWALPKWQTSDQIGGAEGLVQALLPGAWAPQVIRPLLLAAAVFAAFHAFAGLWLERRAAKPLPWAALVAAVPVLTLAVAYAQIARFQIDARWAAVALALTVGLTDNAWLAARQGARQRAGVHAAGAVAALALGAAMLLHDEWLTLAIALFLPALAWIEARADLPPLRHVALAVAGVVLARLLLNWYVLDYKLGDVTFANGLLAAYAVPAAAFAAAAWLFRRRGDDTLVATLEAGAVAFASYFVALEIRHGFGAGSLAGQSGFAEISLQLLTLSVQATAYLYLAGRTGRPVLRWAWRILGGIALLGGFLLLLLNPALTDARAGALSLLAAYLLPAALAVYARRRIADSGVRRMLAAYALLAGFVWITVQIRMGFHPGARSLSTSPILDAELWAWSGAWLGYGIALMAVGIRTDARLLRLISLGIVGLTCAKVFLIDMADLTGLWRVLSFLGLGLTLIGLGAVHRRFVRPAPPKPAGD